MTDVASAGEAVDGIEIPDTVNVAAEYTIAVLAGSTDEEAASAFIEFVLSDEGQGIMAEHGFRSP